MNADEKEEKAAQAIVSRMRNIQNHLMRGRLRDGSVSPSFHSQAALTNRNHHLP